MVKLFLKRRPNKELKQAQPVKHQCGVVYRITTH